MERSLQLDVTLVQAAPDRLLFRYRARNSWTRELYLFNRLFVEEPSGARRVDPARVYVVVDGTVLHVSKQMFEVPEDVEVEQPEVPYLSRLGPGETFEEEISLPLPVRESYPYMSPPAAASPGEKRTCDQLVFTLGYFHAKEPGWVRSISSGGEPALGTDYGFAIQTNQTVSSALQKVRAECIVVTDPRRRPRT
jgi:hypothetical protein